MRVVHRDDADVEHDARGLRQQRVGAREHIAAGPRGRPRRAAVARRRDRDRADDGTTARASASARAHRGARAHATATPRWSATRSTSVGVPAVINGAGSVFGTPPARDWLRLLEAIERPTSAARARARPRSPPSSAGRPSAVAAADEDDWEDVHRRLHRWARVLRVRGVASLTETITLAEGLPARVLGRRTASAG